MNILFLIEALTSGGAERQLVNLMNGLTKRGHIVYLVTWVGEHHYMPSDIPNVNWIQFQRKGKFDISLFRKIRDLIKRNGIGTVQGFLDTGNLYAWICTIGMKNVYAFASERSSKRYLKGLSKIHKPWIHKLVSKTITNSEAGKNFILQLAGTKANVVVIRNGFDTNLFYPVSAYDKLSLRDKLGIAQDTKVFINVARIIPLKRQLEIVEAFAETYKNDNAKLLLIGSANEQYLAQINSLVYRSNLSDIVLIMPPVNDINMYYNVSDVFILNSDFEGSPNALVEAMLAGLMVISTRCGDAYYYLDGAKNNMLISTGNIDALVDSLKRTSFLNREEIQKIGNQNRLHITNYLKVGINEMVLNYEYQYKNININRNEF